jgi:hypothetical protein
MEEIKKMVQEQPDYIALRRFNHSLAKLLKRYPDGCPNHVIAAALAMTEEEVERTYKGVIEKLKKELTVE